MAVKRRRSVRIANCEKDEWSGFTDFLANLIEKYAVVLDVDNLPEPTERVAEKKTDREKIIEIYRESIENNKVI